MKKAFTMIELIFVIVIVGILSVMIAPSFQRNTLQEAADQVVSHIRYTQHLAMMDNKFTTNDSKWFEGRWQIIFNKSSASGQSTNGKYSYTVFSDSNGSSTYNGTPNIAFNEIATNNLDSDKLLSGGYGSVLDWEDSRATREMNIGNEYGIDNVVFGGGCNSNVRRISFDYIGRPFNSTANSGIPYEIKNSYPRLITKRCTIQLTTGSDSKTIAIEPETGYTHIL